MYLSDLVERDLSWISQPQVYYIAKQTCMDLQEITISNTQYLIV